MPELPEVETVRRGLAADLVGARAVDMWTSGKPLRLNRPIPQAALRQASVPRRVTGVRRVAKYLLLDFDGEGVVLVHLGMTGRLLLAPASEPRPPHTHLAWALADGRELRYVDARRFGSVAVSRRGEEASTAELSVLGVDPLEGAFTTARLAELLAACRRDAKTFLLDQSRVAGIGNIYACEALFEARIHPATRTERLGARRVDVLRRAIVAVLERGVANRGTTLRDYVDASGARGSNQHALAVYGREGQACPRGDGGRVRRVVTQGRSTFYCPVCQRA